VGIFNKLFHPSRKGLNKVIKTRRHWMLPWITGSGVLKDEQLEEDREKLRSFIATMVILISSSRRFKPLNPTPRTMVLPFVIYEGSHTKSARSNSRETKSFSTAEITGGTRRLHNLKGGKARLGPNGLEMDVGDIFTPKGRPKISEAVEDFYGAKGYIDVSTSLPPAI